MFALALLVTAAAQGWCLAHSPLHPCAACRTETDCQTKPDGKTWYCQAAKDPACGGPALGACKKDAPEHKCEPCSSEEDCGHTPDGKVFYCAKAADPQCGPAPPAPKPKSTGFCAHNAPNNTCHDCSSEEDCGHKLDGKVWYCLQEKDAACGAKTTGFCTHDAPKNTCHGCNSEEDCGHTLDGKAWYCLQNKDQQCGGHHPAGPSGWCASWAPGRCGNCTSDLDCGNEKDACWARKDPQCAKPTIELV